MTLLRVLLWFSAALTAAGMSAAVLLIGKPEKPTTPGTAHIVLVLNGVVVWACVWAAVTTP